MTKSEGLFKVGIVDCAEPANAKLCKAEGADAYPFRAYPYGGDKEGEAKGFVAPAAAYQECGESLPDTLRPIGDGSNQGLLDQQVGACLRDEFRLCVYLQHTRTHSTHARQINLAFGAYKLPIVIITNKPEPAALFKALALKFEPFLHFLYVTNPSKSFLAQFQNAVVPSVHILIPQVRDRSHACTVPSYPPN